MRRSMGILAAVLAMVVLPTAAWGQRGGGGCSRGGGASAVRSGGSAARMIVAAGNSSGGGATTTPLPLTSAERQRMILQQFDADYDGLLTGDELQHMAAEMKRRGYSATATARFIARWQYFQRFDTNRDAHLTPAETAAAQKTLAADRKAKQLADHQRIATAREAWQAKLAAQ